MPTIDMTTEIDHAARILHEGGLVAMPTETVYGLAADAQSAQAVEKIYRAKQRPANHPLIVHIAPEADLSYWTRDVPVEAEKLIRAFWPGPLTLILPKNPAITDAVTGGQDSIGLRCPSHPVAMELIRAFARLRPSGQAGIAAPSANRFGHVSPTKAEHVRQEFPQECARGMPVLEGGDAEIGIESTIVDASRIDQGMPVVLLRPGHISAPQLAQVLGYVPARPDAGVPRASGTLKAHYAPQTRLSLFDAQELECLLAARPGHERWAIYSFDAAPLSLSSQLQWHRVPSDPVRYAHDLYALLRQADQQHLDHLLIQRLPGDAQWDAVADRLQRAAAAFE
ncbi:threonylcarbamoyl-AMP synthase [Advenella sp. S44]|uniref:L-threonylcarbamoyladenylate synthase n=1 Tax=Advenella sp. S44 TaxID=1982755 RepID=UPI000C29C110|nr:L-threonylcarbamoyladenylate synthase [Advenella sp. S44]PJX25908.1 threonylcarbamoyl-AMP synthase [Advenella sp. S44]